MSSVPKNKHELEQAIRDAFTKILADYESIPAEYTRIAGVEGNVKGTEITVCDTLAYLIGWENLVLKWHRQKTAGVAVDFPETGFAWNQLGLLAQHFYAQREDTPYLELIAELSLVTEEVLELIASHSNDQLYGAPWYKKYTFGKMIQYNTSSPMKNMRTKVRRFKRSHNLP